MINSSSLSFQEAVRHAKEQLGISILELNWEDHQGFIIPDDGIATSCLFIHEAISSGSSVLVHCAQVIVWSLVVGSKSIIVFRS